LLQSNFIDLSTIEALESFIEAYPTVLLTSHDWSFIENTADQVYVLKNQKLKLIHTEESI